MSGQGFQNGEDSRSGSHRRAHSEAKTPEKFHAGSREEEGLTVTGRKKIKLHSGSHEAISVSSNDHEAIKEASKQAQSKGSTNGLSNGEKTEYIIKSREEDFQRQLNNIKLGDCQWQISIDSSEIDCIVCKPTENGQHSNVVLVLYKPHFSKPMEPLSTDKKHGVINSFYNTLIWVIKLMSIHQRDPTHRGNKIRYTQYGQLKPISLENAIRLMAPVINSISDCGDQAELCIDTLKIMALIYGICRKDVESKMAGVEEASKIMNADFSKIKQILKEVMEKHNVIYQAINNYKPEEVSSQTHQLFRDYIFISDSPRCQSQLAVLENAAIFLICCQINREHQLIQSRQYLLVEKVLVDTFQDSALRKSGKQSLIERVVDARREPDPNPLRTLFKFLKRIIG